MIPGPSGTHSRRQHRLEHHPAGQPVPVLSPLQQPHQDYMRPAVRLAALMQLPATYVWTHDSIGLGEDGPTHQPVEHLAALRAIPGLDVVRPGDANETAVCWRTILEQPGRPGWS